MQENPLASYFRRPSIYITLPSNGKFYPDGVLEMTENNELPVYPMTAVDEITYRTPDALFNGTSVVDVIQSCVPNIKDAWKIPSIDLDTILSAIRIASYGSTLEIGTTCPKCKEEAEYGVDLRSIIEQLNIIKYENEINVGDLEIHIRPLTYKDINESSMVRFEEQKLASVLEDTAMNEEDKLALLSKTFTKISEITISTIAKSIEYVKTPETTVFDFDQINGFLRNCERSVFDTVKEKVLTLKSNSELEPLKIKCQDCEHEYKQPFTLDMSSFFG
jgi:hypothetical protein